MAISREKISILIDHGYLYNFDRGMYYNKNERKTFSEEAIDDNPPDWLKDRVKREPTKDWQFYTNKELRSELKAAIIKELEK